MLLRWSSCGRPPTPYQDDRMLCLLQQGGAAMLPDASALRASLRRELELLLRQEAELTWLRGPVLRP